MLVHIPAAGAGSRFKKQGICSPKPLVAVNGVTLLEKVIDCFDKSQCSTILISTLKNDHIREKLELRIKKSFPLTQIVWVELGSIKPGQLSTAYHSLKIATQEQPILLDEKLLIHNCDTGFQWIDDLALFDDFASMAVFEADGDHWSFGLPNELNPKIADAIAEKQRISNLASIGLYGFHSVAAFLDVAGKYIENGQTINGEFYIAPLLQSCIEDGLQVSLPRINQVFRYGTPEELCETFNITMEELISNNS